MAPVSKIHELESKGIHWVLEKTEWVLLEGKIIPEKLFETTVLTVEVAGSTDLGEGSMDKSC